MRLVIATKDFPPDVGGIQTYCLELAKLLSRRADSLAVIAPRVAGTEEVDAALPFPVYRVACTRGTFASISALWWRRIWQRQRFDAVLAAQWQMALPALAWRPALAPYRVVCAVHGREILIHHFAKWPLGAQSYACARRYALANADAIAPVSNYALELVRQAGLAYNEAVVVPNGCNPSQFCLHDAKSLRRRLGLDGRRIVLSVGRLVERKGVDTTLHALSKVAQQVPDVTYLIVGEGPDRVRLETLADRLALRHRVRFLGRVPDEDRKTLYAASDLFVLAAREVRPDVEGFGLVMLEAAACGVPTIGTESGGVPETIVPGKTGLLVEPNNPEALATAMTELLLDAERRRQLGAAGRDYVSKSASWEQRAEQLFAVLSGTRSALRSEAPFAEFEGAAQP